MVAGQAAGAFGVVPLADRLLGVRTVGLDWSRAVQKSGRIWAWQQVYILEGMVRDWDRAGTRRKDPCCRGAIPLVHIHGSTSHLGGIADVLGIRVCR